VKKDSHLRSGIKSVIWRLLGILTLAAVTYGFTGCWIQTSLVTAIHHAVFLLVFYLHERAWLKINWKSKWRSVAKMFTYETLLGNIILGLITYLITGDVKKMTAITLTYIGIKHIMYVLYDRLWDLWRKKKVYAYVVADILHIGHIRHLKKAKELGDHLIVGVLTDEACMEKKPKPIIGFEERLQTIESLKYVDEVIPQETYSPLENVKKIRPDILMESDSHPEQPANTFVESYGGRIVETPYYKEISSTKIKNRIKQEKWLTRMAQEKTF